MKLIENGLKDVQNNIKRTGLKLNSFTNTSFHASTKMSNSTKASND
jgi:hypothetical protein